MKKNLHIFAKHVQNISFILIMITCAGMNVNAQTSSNNYVMTETYLDANAQRKVTSVQYCNGLGYPTVVADGGLAPNNYVYSFIQYDKCGRDSLKWVNCAGGTTPEYILPSYLGDMAHSQYNDSSPYVSMEYDALDRQIRITPAGQIWHNADASKTIQYVSNTSQDNIKIYKATDIYSGNTPSLIGYYQPNTLIGEIITDEDGHTLAVYKDMQGRVILERRNGNNDTYYVYCKDFLRFVLPPMCTGNTSGMISKYAYQYKYDTKGRCKEKYLPGCARIEYVYDKNGRLAFMQDGRMRSNPEVWRFYLYDNLNRQVVHGVCDSLPSSIETYSAGASFSNNGQQINNTGYHIKPGTTLYNVKIEVVNYYDNYNFLNMGFVQSIIGNADFGNSNHGNATSFLAGQIVNTTNERPLCSVYYYDEKGNVIDKRETILGGGNLKATTHYTFTNKPDTIVETLTKNGATRTVRLTNSYYSNTDKLDTQKHNYNNGSDVPVAKYGYDDLGRVNYVNRHGTAITNTYNYNINGWTTNIHSEHSSSHTLLFDEQIHYVDGPGIPCYNGNISSTKCITYDHPMGANTFYAYKYRYDGLDRLTKASYGIGSTSASSYMDLSIYDEEVTYDANSNIKSLVRHGQYGNEIIDNLIYNYTGNRLDSIRDSAPSVLSEGFYDFKDNKIVVPDAKEYGYDGCGSITYDLNKGITHIDYDYSGNPTRIQFADYNVTEYIYSADGRRLKSIHRTAVPQSSQLGIDATHNLTASEVFSVDSTEYINDFEFKNGSLSMCKFDGGYLAVPFVPSTYRYYITDHLGNNSLVVYGSGSVQQVTHYYPFGSIHHSSTSQGYQKYKYNGKEYDSMHGLNEYDYGARQYDPAIGMFTSMDPLCEKYYHISPYAYCGGNPVNAIDPDGELIIFINGNHFGDGGTSAYWNGVDNQIMNTTLDFHAFYYDGAMGGNFNRASMSCSNRMQSGYNKGYSDASRIISAASNESLKFVTHSMGGAYGNGFVKGLQQWAKDNNQTLPQIEYVMDIAPYQGEAIEVSPNMRSKTIELSHIDDYIAGGKEKGIVNANFHQSSSGNWLNPTTVFGHGINTFQRDIMQWLPESVIPSFNNNRWEENKSH